jgi:hypothetical protein
MEREATRKITVEVPAQLLEDAREKGEGITETIRKSLEARAQQLVGERIVRMAGKVKFTIPLEELREDRD